MSTRRAGMSAWEWDRKNGVEHGPNGFRLCRLCKTETTYKRATLCSEACRIKWDVLTSPSYARRRVYERDKGVCAVCSLDTEMLVKLIKAPQGAYSKFPYRERPASRFLTRKPHWYHPLLGNRQSLWDMDHIVPVIDGGGECDLGNLQTMCLWCHREKTAAMAKRRAKERRNAKPKPPQALRQSPAVQLQLIALDAV